MRKNWFTAKAQYGDAYDWLPDFLEHQAPKSSEGYCADGGTYGQMIVTQALSGNCSSNS
jgi:hypothetical protein